MSKHYQNTEAYQKWYQMHEDANHLCHKCWLFWCDRSGEVLCIDNICTDENSDSYGSFIPVSYCQTCDMYFPAHQGRRK